jgi:hypothetical protein
MKEKSNVSNNFKVDVRPENGENSVMNQDRDCDAIEGMYL